MHFGDLFRPVALLENVLIPNGSIGISNIDNRVTVVVDGTETPPDKVQLHHPDESERVLDIKVNRPFLFYVIDMESRVPYFSGVVANFDEEGQADSMTHQFESEKEFVPTGNCQKILYDDSEYYDYVD